MVEGLAQFQRRWRDIPRKVREAAKEALEAGAQELVDDMKAVVPVDRGLLRDSIGWTWGDAPEGALTLGTVSGNEYATLRITIYAGRSGNNLYDKGYYARFVEFGTVNSAARPFFYPVYRARKRRVKSRVTRAITKAIKSS